MAIPFINLAAQYAELRGELEPRVRTVFETGRFIMGEEVTLLEREIAALAGVTEGVGVDSGTRALELILRGLGVGPGDEVITTPFTFFATVSSILSVGARPVFADIDPATFNIDPARVAALVTPRTKAIVPVHLFGLMADMPALLAAAGSIPVVEDACQAIGATLACRPAGSYGRAAALSFFPTKNLGGAGDGGMVLTSDPELAARVRMLRNHGSRETYRHEEVGCTGRLDALQAVVLRTKLPHLARWNEARAANAAAYDAAFAGRFASQAVPAGSVSAWHQYTVRVPDRDALQKALAADGVPSAVYYPVPAHLQPACRAAGAQAGDCPAAERAAAEVLSLPVCPYLAPADREAVIAAMLRHGAGPSD